MVFILVYNITTPILHTTVDGDVYSAIHESLESFNAADLGLCKTAITKYMRSRKLS